MEETKMGGKRDVAARLMQYATVHVETISKEYYRQTLKWKAYLNQVADAQTHALQHVQDVLEDIKRKQAEADRMMLMAFSLIGIAGASWIGAIVELKLYPRFAGKIHFKEFQTFGGWRIKTELEYSEVAAKTLGDSIHEVTGLALDAIFERVWPKEEGPRKMDLALSSTIEAGQVGSFKSNLENALLAASAVITGQLGTLSENINRYESPEGGGFGDALVRILEKRFPRPKNMKDDAFDDLQERNGHQMLDEYFDKLRRSYARTWFYYGNNPLTAQLPFIQFDLEIETWALWILNQDWKTKYAGLYSEDAPVITYWATDDGFDLDSIMDALEDLAGKELRDNLKLQPKKIPLKNQPGWVQEINPQADDDRDAARDLLDSAKRMDEDTDLAKILSWAGKHPGKRLHGNLDYRARNIGSLANPSSVFAD
jgi:hypothetical protein